jgi:hypothetical protein
MLSQARGFLAFASTLLPFAFSLRAAFTAVPVAIRPDVRICLIEDVAVDAVRLSVVDASDPISSTLIDPNRNEFEMSWIDASPIPTEMVNRVASASRTKSSDKETVGRTMRWLGSNPRVRNHSVARLLVDVAEPNPAASPLINSDTHGATLTLKSDVPGRLSCAS